MSNQKAEETGSPRKLSKRLSVRFRFGRRDREDESAEGGSGTQVQDDGAERKPSKFIRRDSVTIKVKPGQVFSPYADIYVVSAVKCDPKLGTLGELRHYLQTGTKAQVKRFIRINNWTMQHRIRAELWKELCRRDGSLDSRILVYKEKAEKMSSRIQPSFISHQGVVLCNHLLNEVGKNVVLQILSILEITRPDFTKIPILHPLSAALLHYMTEEEVYACLVKMMEQNQKYLLQTDIAFAASKRTLLTLTKKHLGRVYSLFSKLIPGVSDDKLVPVFEEWLGWIFRDLPFPHLVRVMDCFMYEGQKVLYRVALAIIYLWTKQGYKALKNREVATGEIIAEEISEFCKGMPSTPEKLMRTGFGVRNLKMSKIRSLQERYELEGRKSTSSPMGWQKQSVVSPVLGDVTMETKILNSQQVGVLISWLPERIQLLSPFRLFSVHEDGTSFTRLWQKIDEADRTVIVIRTGNKEIIGAYCSCSWLERRLGKSGFFGTGESFLFRLQPNPKKFPWVGTQRPTTGKYSEDLFLTASATTLQIGGGSGEGLSVREELVTGSTSYCETFDNEPLVEGGIFDIGDFEVFTFATEIEE